MSNHTLQTANHSKLKITDLDLEAFKERIEKLPNQFFAFLDACDEPRVPIKVRELGRDLATSLYRGSAEQDFWAIAPYLVEVDVLTFDWIVANLWDDPWGLFFSSSANLTSLRTHFRRFLRVELPNQQKVFFRFYDPRVLTTFLTTATSEEAQQFFGPIESFFCSAGSSKLKELHRARA